MASSEVDGASAHRRLPGVMSYRVPWMLRRSVNEEDELQLHEQSAQLLSDMATTDTSPTLHPMMTAINPTAWQPLSLACAVLLLLLSAFAVCVLLAVAVASHSGVLQQLMTPPPRVVTSAHVTPCDVPSPSAVAVEALAPPLSLRFVLNRTHTVSSPTPELLRVGEVLEVCYNSDSAPVMHWIGMVTATADDGQPVHVPVLRLLEGVGGRPASLLSDTVPPPPPPPLLSLSAECGVFVLPWSGSWTLTVLQPQSLPSLSDDLEPFPCYPLLMTRPELQRVIASTYDSINRSMSACGWDPVTATSSMRFIPVHAPPVLKREQSVVAMLHFNVSSSSTIDPSSSSQAQLEHQAYERAFGSAAAGHVGSVGYWYRPLRTLQADRSPGSSEYQPEPVGCPVSFGETTAHQSACDKTSPALQWHPIRGSRAEYLTSPGDLFTYLNHSALIVVGDSMGFALWRGMHCVTSGYAAIFGGVLAVRLVPVHNAVEMLAMFPSLDRQIQPSYEDFLRLVRPPVQGGYSGYAGTKRVHYLWSFGLWMVSYVPRSDWARGLTAIFTHITRYQQEALVSTGEQQRHSFCTLTAIQTEGPDPGWQTDARVQQWNALITRMSTARGFLVIDLHTPSSTRYDARTDNCHYCDTAVYELAHLTLHHITHNDQH